MFQLLGNSTLGYVRTSSLFYYLYDAFSAGGASLLDSEEGYGMFMPLVILSIFWLKRRELLGQQLRLWWPGLVLVALGLMLHLFGFLIQQPRISVVGLFTGIYGLMGLTWGWAWLRASFFPFFLFAFCVPLGSVAIPVTFRLRLLVSQIVAWIAHNLLFINVLREGTSLINPTEHYSYEVAAACSGIKSLMATLAFSVVFGFYVFQSWWKRAVMVGAAFPLAIAGNLLRMLTIIVAAELGGQEWGKYVHDGGPWHLLSLLPYIPAFWGLLVLEKYLRGPRLSHPGASMAQKAEPL